MVRYWSIGFEVPTARVRELVYADFQYLPVAAACSSSVGLPVDYLGIAARGEAGRIVVDWETAEERDNKGFEIERSDDGHDFNFIGWQAAKPGAANGSKYAFADENVSGAGLYYYRLRQIDFDGTAALSSIVVGPPGGHGGGSAYGGAALP